MSSVFTMPAAAAAELGYLRLTEGGAGKSASKHQPTMLGIMLSMHTLSWETPCAPNTSGWISGACAVQGPRQR